MAANVLWYYQNISTINLVNQSDAGRDRKLEERSKLGWYVFTDPVTGAMEKQAVDNEPGPTLIAC